MRFVLVNGRRPRAESFCALCCEPIGEGYVRELGHCKIAFSVLKERARASLTVRAKAGAG